MESTNYNYDKKRFETFIDAVIAIILTILVLELKIPENEHTGGLSTQQQLLGLVPSFISYIASYLLIVGVWIDHHVLFLNLKKLTKRFILLNMFFALSLSIVPFTTAFAGHNPKDSFAVALLFVNYVIMNLTFSFLYIYSYNKKIISEGYLLENRKTAIYSYVGILALIIAIPIAYFNTYISFALGIIIFIGHLMKKKQFDVSQIYSQHF